MEEETTVNDMRGEAGKFIGYIQTDKKTNLNNNKGIPVTLNTLASYSFSMTSIESLDRETSLSNDALVERRRQVAELILRAMQDMDSF